MIPAAALASILLLSGCGIKGPLFLPPNDSPPTPEASAPTEAHHNNNFAPPSSGTPISFS
jgi:predicted small lipoprotein YifL